MQEFTEDFYLELLRYFEYQFSTNYHRVDFYWGKDDSRKYYWGDSIPYEDVPGEVYMIKVENLNSVKDVVESIFSYLEIGE